MFNFNITELPQNSIFEEENEENEGEEDADNED